MDIGARMTLDTGNLLGADSAVGTVGVGDSFSVQTMFCKFFYLFVMLAAVHRH